MVKNTLASPKEKQVEVSLAGFLFVLGFFLRRGDSDGPWKEHPKDLAVNVNVLISKLCMYMDILYHFLHKWHIFKYSFLSTQYLIFKILKN